MSVPKIVFDTAAVQRRRIRPWPLAIVLFLVAAAALVAVVVVAALSATASAPHGAPAAADPFLKLGLGGRSGSARPGNAVSSGAAIPTGNLPGWKQVFSYNFADSPSVPAGGFNSCTNARTIMTSSCSGLPRAVRSKLWAYPDGWPDFHNGRYEPSKVLSIHNGMLDYYLHTSGNTHMVAAVVPKIPGGVAGNGLLYGAYAVRFKATPVPGYKTAFLLWPDSDKWPADGEIDFPEGDLNGTMGAFMHHLGGTSVTSQDPYFTGVTYTGWHTAIIEWTPTQCRFILDGRTVGTSTSLIPNTPMHWVLQAETVRGSAPASKVAGHIYVAWITAYTRD